MLAALLLTAATPAPATGAWEAAAVWQAAPLETRVLEAFDAQCATLDSADKMTARIAASGWQAFTPEPGTPLATLLNFFTANPPSPDWKMENWAFARGADREIVIVVTLASGQSFSSLECRSIAIDARQRPSAAIVEKWAGKPAPVKVDQSGLVAWKWEPGLRPTHRSTAFAYVAPDSPVVKQLPLRGMTAMATR